MNAGYRTTSSPPPWLTGYPSRSPRAPRACRPGRRLRRRRDRRAHSSEPGSTESTPPNARPPWAGVTVGVAVAVTLGVAVVGGPGRVGEITTVGGPLGRGLLPRVGVPVGQAKGRGHGGFFARGFFTGSLPTWSHFAPVNTGLRNCSCGSFANAASANVCQIAAGQVPPKPPPPSVVSDCGEFEFCDWVKIPTASEYCGIAPMKKAAFEFVVVPVLPMIGRPSVIAAAVPVPLTVVCDIAYWTCESSDGVSTWRWVTMPRCTGALAAWYVATTCAEWYVPPLAIVDSIVACSLTVSEPVPSAMPTWPTLSRSPEPSGNEAMFTPKFAAMLMMALVPARWARSV